MANYRRKTGAGYSKRKQGSFAWVWLCTGILLGIISVIYTYPLFQQGLSVNTFKRFFSAKSSRSSSTTHATMEQKIIIKKKKPETEEYEFYTMLPDMEVALPKENPEASHKPKIPYPVAEKPLLRHAEENSVQPKPPVSPSSTKIRPAVIIQTQNKKALARQLPDKVAPKTRNYPKNPKQSPVELNKTKSTQYLIQAGMYRSAKEADGLKARLALHGFNTRLQKIDAEDGLWFRVIMGPFKDESFALAQQKCLEKQKIKAILVMQRKLK